MIGKFNTIGKEEEAAVLRVIRSGNLSGYVASKMGAGPEVRGLQTEWEKFFKVDNAIPCNSATSGLLAACMAIGVGPGDEVIVPYFTMSATACAPAVLGATIILADIEPDTFCLSPSDVANQITESTKAVIATNMFGHPAKLHQLRSICDSRGIYLIEDNAQAIMAKENGKYTGTIGHIGVFSLNVHKHIQTGEGGVCVVNDNDEGLYVKLAGAINHGECRGQAAPGLNLRMTEITAAIAREQLKKLPKIVAGRQEVARGIIEAVEGTYFKKMEVRTDCEHSYYALPLIVNIDYSATSMVQMFRNQNLTIPVEVGYDGNLLDKPLSNTWLTQDRMYELIEGEAYKSLNRLIMIEVCSYDIKPEHIARLRKIFR